VKVHHHHTPGSHSHETRATQTARPLVWVLVLTVLYLFVEVVGGMISGSLALLGDALHMFTDAGGLAISLFAYWLSKRPATPRMTFGYQRAEILGALASGLLIWALAGILVFEGIGRLQEPRLINGPMVSWVALVGLIVNIISARILHSSQQTHLSFRAAYLHVLTDMIGSFGALVSGLVIWRTGWTLIDPLVTFFCVTLVLFSSWQLVTEALNVLMESSPREIDSEALVAQLKLVDGVQAVHDLHVWTVSKGKPALSVHLMSERSDQELLSEVHELLHAKFKIHHTTVQIENPKEFKSDCCFGCDPADLAAAKDCRPGRHDGHRH